MDCGLANTDVLEEYSVYVCLQLGVFLLIWKQQRVPRQTGVPPTPVIIPITP